MQDRIGEGQVRYRTGRMKDRIDAGQGSDTVQVGCRTGLMSVRSDTGQVRCTTAQKQDRSDAGQD